MTQNVPSIVLRRVSAVSCRYWQCLPGPTPPPPPPSVPTGQGLSLTPLYSDNYGGLTEFCPLAEVLPSQTYKLVPDSSKTAADCNADGFDDECAKVTFDGMTHSWTTITTAVYRDAPGQSITLCLCSGAPFTIDSLAQSAGQVC